MENYVIFNKGGGVKMSGFKVGYAEVNINPNLGIGISGYYVPRYAKGFLDDLKAKALALSCNDKNILLISVDHCMIPHDITKKFCTIIEKITGIVKENIFLSATHSHTAPLLPPANMFFETDEKAVDKYCEFLSHRLVDAAILAIHDLRNAKMGYCVGYAPERVAYIRRYKMKDGSTMTCPPINDPNIAYPLGELDQRVNVLRFDRNEGESIVLVNYGLHADTIGGELLSGDWPAWMSTTIEKALDGTKCIFFAGAEGDVGSTNVYPSGGDMNDTEISFDNEMKSPGMARFIGRALAGTVLQVYDKVCYVDVDKIDVLHKTITVPANVPEKEDLPQAHKYKKLHEEGRDHEIPYTAMELTTVVAEALRMCKLENGPSEFKLELIGVRIGDIAFIGIPGEPFTDIGVKIKENNDWLMILPCALTNGAEGYFPTEAAYNEGGYEARTSPYKSCVADRIITGAREMLMELK